MDKDSIAALITMMMMTMMMLIPGIWVKAVRSGKI